MQKFLDAINSDRKTAALVIAAAVFALVILWVTNAPQSEEVVSPEISVGITSPNIFVHVVGEVVSPGLYEIAPGERVADAIDMAGGFTANALVGSVNLARSPSDGDQIVVFSIENEDIGVGLVAINTAKQSEFETLPGVGPALAKRIIDYRNLNGSFSSIEALDNVSGIGPAMLEKLRDLIRL